MSIFFDRLHVSVELRVHEAHFLKLMISLPQRLAGIQRTCRGDEGNRGEINGEG